MATTNNDRLFINPVLTSGTSYGTVSADSEYSSGSTVLHPAWAAFDGDTGDGSNTYSDKWLNTNASSGWLQWALPDGEKWTITKFDIYGSDLSARTPKYLEFLGSNDGTTWATLVTANIPSLSRGSRHTVSVDTTGQYNTYRWNFPRGNNGGSVGIAVGEIVVYYVNPALEDSMTAGINAAAMAYCMAYNKLASQMIEVQKKAYRKGLKDGHDGSTGTDTGRMPTEVITDVPVPSDGNIPLGDGGGNSGTGEVTAPAAFDFSGGGLYIKTASISITDDSGTVVTGVFQLHITLDLSYQETANEGHTVKTGRLFLRLTGNGVDKSMYVYDYSGWRWKGYDNYGTAYNSCVYYPFEAHLYTGGLYEHTQVDYCNTSTGEVTSSETISLYWEFSGDYRTALNAGAYYGTVPFADVK